MNGMDPGGLRHGDRIVFFGDSITDAGRVRSQPAHLGGGYALMTAAWIGAVCPELEIECRNRGIGGDRVRNLRARLDADALSAEPAILSILVGVNDTWRRFDAGEETSPEAFERDYRAILDRARARIPGIRLVLMEPFLLPVPPVTPAWREDLEPRIRVVRRLARETGARHIPLDDLFAAAAKRAEPAAWAADGVHPTPAGHALIARAWLAAMGVRG